MASLFYGGVARSVKASERCTQKVYAIINQDPVKKTLEEHGKEVEAYINPKIDRAQQATMLTLKPGGPQRAAQIPCLRRGMGFGHGIDCRAI